MVCCQIIEFIWSIVLFNLEFLFSLILIFPKFGHQHIELAFSFLLLGFKLSGHLFKGNFICFLQRSLNLSCIFFELFLVDFCLRWHKIGMPLRTPFFLFFCLSHDLLDRLLTCQHYFWSFFLNFPIESLSNLVLYLHLFNSHFAFFYHIINFMVIL